MSFLTTFSDEASKTYKDAARAATTGPINLSSAPASIGSVNLNLNDRVLVKDQLNGAENGIYVFKGVGLPLVRSTDANSDREVLPNMLISVSEGDYADKIFELTTNGPIALGTTPLSFGLAILPIDLTTDVVGVLPVANGGTNRSSWTEGRIPFAGSSGSSLTEDSELNWVNSTKRLGIGTASPNAKVQINNSGTQVGLSVYSTSTNNALQFFNQGTTSYTAAFYNSADSAQTGASIGGYFSRGTLAARTQSLANDVLLSLTGSGYTGSAFAPSVSGGIVVAADQNTTAGGFGGQVSIVTTPNNTLGLPLPRLTVKNDGKVGIGTLTPTSELHVYNQGSSSIHVQSEGSAIVNSSNSSFDTSAPRFSFIRSRGTLTSPTAVLAGDTLGIITGSGRYGFGTSDAADIKIIAASNFTSSSSPGDLVFSTTAPLNIGSTERVRITANGEVRVLNLTASQLVATDASKNLQSLDTATYPSLTELSYVKGVTSGIQTQLNDKEKKGYYSRVATGISYVMSATDDYVGCTANNITITLPLASSVGSGKRVIIKDESGTATSGAISIVKSVGSSDTIDGNASESLTVNYESITLVCDGASKWFIV